MPAPLVTSGHRLCRSLAVSAWAVAVAVGISGCSNDHQAAPAPTGAATTSAATTAPGVPSPISSPILTAIPAPTSTPERSLAADLANGRVLVQAQCAACHALADAGITGANHPVARALDGIGGRHDRVWVEAELNNACAHHKATSHFSCRQVHGIVAALTQKQRNQVVDYLLSLR